VGVEETERVVLFRGLLDLDWFMDAL